MLPMGTGMGPAQSCHHCRFATDRGLGVASLPPLFGNRRDPCHYQSMQTDAHRDAILDALNEGVFTVDQDFAITSLNAAAEELTGVDREQAQGMPCRSVFRANICDQQCALRESLASGEPIHCRPAVILDADGQQVPVSISTNILRDDQGRIIGGVETFRDMSQLENLRRQLVGRYQFGDMVARSQCMQDLFAVLPVVAESDSPVLITGESGTGKELVARALHHESLRAEKPFIAVNCGALPDNLLESELFGYKKGAFTDARQDKPGRFALAKGGTLFLDEIGDISPAMQVRLLRVLQEKCYEPLGAVRSERSDVRIIAATNRDLSEEMRAGRFRSDLFYRLNVIPLALPPLRQRRDDIPYLVDYFLRQLSERQGVPSAGYDEEVLRRLLSYDFPGNIRELENLIERLWVLGQGGRLRAQHLPPELGRSDTSAHPSLDEPDCAIHDADPLAQAERQALLKALAAHQGNRQHTANALGMHKTTLLRKLKRLGIQSA